MARFVVAGMDKALKNVVWTAENKPAEGGYLVALDLAPGVHEKAPEHYRDTPSELSRQATCRQDRSERTWFFSTELSLDEVFQIIVQNLGTEHCYSVTELRTGEGLAYNAKRRTVYEFSAKAT